ncbi:MAG: nucleotidyl transferase AbiEii/AbiGii toxin family protein [Sandaracinaceae bacterium]
MDVDIVTTVDKAELTRVVEQIVAESASFTRCQVRPHRTKPWLPILSFKIFFDSIYPDVHGEEAPCVLLDAVLEPAPYGGVRKRVTSGALYDAPYEVELPSVGGLLADKMLCISPATVGIPLGKGKDAHRLKHVFDVANLSRHEPDIDEVRDALVACLAQENNIQKSQWTFDQVADDTVDFCEQVLAHEERPPLESVDPASYLFEIVRGFPEVNAFFFREDYDWPQLRRDCAAVIAAVQAAR